jgi:hypothetical protein
MSWKLQGGGDLHLSDIVTTFEKPKEKEASGFNAVAEYVWGLVTDAYAANLSEKGTGN